MKSTQLTKFYALGLVALSACRTTVIEAPSEEATSAAISSVPSPDAPVQIVVPATNTSSTHSSVEAIPTNSESKTEPTYVDKKVGGLMVKMTIDADRIHDEIDELTNVYNGIYIPAAELKATDKEGMEKERLERGSFRFKTELLAAYAVTDPNWLLLDGETGDLKARKAEKFINVTVLGSKDPAPPRVMALHRLAFKYAYYDTEGLDMNRTEAVDFADKVIAESSPEQYLLNHKAALMYAVYDPDGLKRSIVEGRDFADKIAARKDGAQVLREHKAEFLKAKENQGSTEALRVANKATGLN